MKKFRRINILKGLGIIAVVLGHVGFPFTNVIYLYHMALFFFISGYLYKESCEANLLKYTIKKFKSLYIPFIIFELIFVSLRNTFIDFGIYNPSNIVRFNNIEDLSIVLKEVFTFNYTGDSMIGAIWFLRVLFYVSVLYAVFNTIFKKIVNKDNDYLKTFIIIILAAISFELIRKGLNPSILLNPNGNKIPKLFLDIFDARNFILMSIFYIGTLYKKYEEKIAMNIYVALICLIGLYYNTRIGSIDVSTYNFVDPIYFILNAIIGIYINIYIAHIICSSKFKFRILESAGRFSLYIMMLHLISCKIIDMIIITITKMPNEIISGYPVSFYGKYMWVVYTIVGVIVPLIIAKVYTKSNKIVKKLLNIKNKHLIEKNI